VPVEAEFDDEERGEGEGDDAYGGEGVAEVRPVARPKVEDAAGNEGEGDRVGADHPLAVLGDVAVARGDDGGGGADHPGRGLHGGAGEPGAPVGEGDSGEGAYEDGEEVDAAEDAVELDVPLAEAGGEVERADEEGEGSGEGVRDEERVVGDDLEAVGVVHRVVGEEEDFRGDEDEEGDEADG